MLKTDIHKLHDEEKLRNRRWIASRYYDYPDGQDLVGKLSFTTKIAFYASSFFGIVNSSTYPIPPTASGRLLRYFQIVVPAVGMAATFTCATYFATNIRQKDDQINYAIGGALAGLVLAPALKHPHWAFWAPFYCAIAGAVKKDCQMRGVKVIPDVKRSYPSSYFLRKDFSLLSDPVGGNWTKELPK